MVNEKTRLMAEIVLLAMQVQEKTSHAVFVRFSGHVDSMNIEIAQSKENYSNKLAESNFYTKEDSVDRLKEVKETLLRFLDEGFSTEGLDYWIEEVYHYTF